MSNLKKILTDFAEELGELAEYAIDEGMTPIELSKVIEGLIDDYVYRNQP